MNRENLQKLADFIKTVPQEIFDMEDRGHEIEFWEQVQHLHDRDFHWTETGLSEDGHNKIKQIKEQFNL